MRSRVVVKSGGFAVGLFALIAACILALSAPVQGADTAPLTARVNPAVLALTAPQSSVPCGGEYHNFPRTMDGFAKWSPVSGALRYDVQIDCFDCRQVGKWDSEVGPPFQLNGLTSPNVPHTFQFWGDNKGRWRARGEFPGGTATTRPLPPKPGEWGPWCEFRFKTGQQPPTGDNKLPDITDVEKGFIIGGSVGGGALPSGVVGKSVAWNTVVQLTEADAFLKSNGQCAFNLHYNMKNIGPVATAPVAPPAPGPRFNNKWYRDATMVSQQTNLYLAAGAAEAINTQAYLTPGAHGLKVVLNDGFVVPESNTANNSFGIRYILEGKCEGPGPAGVPGQ